jgi:hypothetical protein
MLYTISAAARLLNVETDDITELTFHPLRCQIDLKSDWTVIVPQRDFIEQFISDRKAKAKALVATQDINDGQNWTVWNPENKHSYQVTVTKEAVCCTCPDWKHQAEAFGRQTVCCKHGYAVLAQLKFDSLRDYLKAWQPDGRLYKMQSKLTPMSR